ncbi:hypothetical protein, partial [Mesorhizobium sp.]
EKVDRRAAPRRLRGAGRNAIGARLEHPSSVAFGDTFSHKGRRQKPGGARLDNDLQHKLEASFV